MNEDELKRQVFDFLNDVPLDEGDSELQKERDNLFEQLQRTAAEFANYKKRIERDREEREQAKVREFVLDLIPVLDDLVRVLQSKGDPDTIYEGLEIITNELDNVLGVWNIDRIPTIGRVFDPNIHEAVYARSSDLPSGVVIEEVSRGYTMCGRVLKVAQVVVSK